MLLGPGFLMNTRKPASWPDATAAGSFVTVRTQSGFLAATLPAPSRSRAIDAAVKTVANRPRRLRITSKNSLSPATPALGLLLVLAVRSMDEGTVPQRRRFDLAGSRCTTGWLTPLLRC